MALLSCSSLVYGYTDERVLVDASGALLAGNVIGLVGANGCGKTTLLRLLLGELQPEAGRVQRAKGLSVAYVSQVLGGDDADVLFPFVRAGRGDLIGLERAIAELSEKLAADPDDQDANRRLGEAQARFGALGGHDWEREVERLLLGLSFSPADFGRPLSELSGGQRQKACLARALLAGADCLILDEPTNHLDLDAQAFFVDYLRGQGGERGVILVSHDRWLLDALATHLWEIEDGVLYRYVGNYTRYVPARELRRRQAREAYQRQQEHIARTEEYIRRNIAGQNTRQARGRRTLLARMERLERPADDPQVSFILKPLLRTGDQVLLVERLAFGYGADSTAGQRSPTHVSAGPPGLDLNPALDVKHSAPAGRLVLDELNFQLFRGERLGIVGPNGCGKTTLLKLLAKQLLPAKGLVAWGANTELGLFSQDSADLEAGNDLIAELRRVEPTLTDSDARAYLARFGFSGDDVFALVSSLSGGERNRLSLAKIFRRRPNVLLLDEPTNHLDLYAREALEQFLEAYEGTVLMVTHDRTLLERLCNRLVVFSAENGGFASAFFRGGYRDYLTWRERTRTAKAVGADAPAETEADPERPDASRPEALSLYDVEYLAREAHSSVPAYLAKCCERAQRRMAQLEENLAGLDGEVAALQAEQRAADQRNDVPQLARLQERIDALGPQRAALEAQLDEALSDAAAWERLLKDAAGRT